MKMAEALENGGFNRYRRDEFAKAEKQLKQLGRERAGKLYGWLLEADLAMKGSHSAPHRARFVLERLILRMSKGLSQKHRQMQA
ncbi:MAG: hypothetical protein IH991_17900 [Planctomycetes bacterium]|nr:hypothetical protein [Planctomycetota bacterium]